MSSKVKVDATDTTQAKAEEAKPADTNTQVAAPEPKPDVEPAKTDESPKDEPKSDAEPAAEKPAEPVKYDLKLPEGSLMDSSFVKKVEDFAKKEGLTNEQAQEIIENENKAVATFVETRKATWHQEAINDPEIGGDNLNKNVALASRYIDRFASPKLKQELDRTGYGNHPEFVRMIVRAAQDLGDDKIITSNTFGAGKKTVEEIMYGKNE